MKVYYTINEAHEETGLSVDYLRKGCKRGTVPHIKSGVKYLINVPMLMEKLEENSAKNGGEI